jgi:WD40 repeat protein
MITDVTLRRSFGQTERLKRTLRGHQKKVYSAAFSPDGKTVVTASKDSTARLWSAADGTALATLSGHQGRVLSAAFSPDGKMVVTASWDETAHLWKCTVCDPPEELIKAIETRIGMTANEIAQNNSPQQNKTQK